MSFQEILEIVLKYWLNVLLGVIAANVAIFWKKIVAWYKKTKQNSQDALVKQIKDEILDKSEQDDKILQQEIDSVQEQLQTVTDGVLSIQGKNFKQECRNLLDTSHVLTLDEWQDIQEEHRVYNKLGGNHTGDQLFDLVNKKAENTFGK